MAYIKEVVLLQYPRKKVDTARGVRPIFDFAKVNKIINLTEKPRNKLMLALGFYTGFRISDILSIRARDIKGQEIKLFEQKTGKTRRVVITKNLQNYITDFFSSCDEILLDTDFIFTSQKSNGKPMTRQHALRIVKRECERVGITEKIGTHTLRKTSACMVYKSHPDRIVASQKFLNHSTQEETYAYLWLYDDYMDDIVNSVSDMLDNATSK